LQTRLKRGTYIGGGGRKVGHFLEGKEKDEGPGHELPEDPRSPQKGGKAVIFDVTLKKKKTQTGGHVRKKGKGGNS